MQYIFKNIFLLALFFFIGVGCTPTDADPTTLPGTDSVMTEEEQTDDTMAGGTMHEDDAMAGDEAMNDDNMIGGDAMKHNDDTVTEQDQNALNNNNEAMPEHKMVVKGTYEVYASEKIAKATNSDVVLFFHASWCPTCRALERDIQANLDDIPENLVILKTDYDTERELKKKYSVTIQHTFVQVDANGKLIKKWSGGNTLDSVVKQVQ